MSSELHDKVLNGLEKSSNSSGNSLKIHVENQDGVWIIQFQSGYAAIKVRMSTFIENPKIVLDPFVEEIIKRNL